MLPFTVADYVDFYSWLETATGPRPDAPTRSRAAAARTGVTCRWAITAARARSSSAGRRCTARKGQSQAGGCETPPSFGPSRRLDIELELGFVVGVAECARRAGHAGSDVSREHVFGVVLVNDWSAREIQGWEYVPLGPFLGKKLRDLHLFLGHAPCAAGGAGGCRHRAGGRPSAVPAPRTATGASTSPLGSS